MLSVLQNIKTRFQFQLGTIGTTFLAYHKIYDDISIPVRYDWNPVGTNMHCVCVSLGCCGKDTTRIGKNVDVGKLISDGAMTTVFQSGTMLSKNSNFNFHEQY